jgi:hypothetical protein
VWTLPLVGDISPDVDPEWLMDVPWSDLALGYYRPDTLPLAPHHAGWGALFGRSAGEPVPARSGAGMESFGADGWHRFDTGPLTLLWHAEPTGESRASSHGHGDFGGAVLYWNDCQLLADPGRCAYTADGDWAASCAAHNTIRVDGLPPTVESTAYPDWYRRRDVEARWDAPHQCFELRHRRLRGARGALIDWTRRWQLGGRDLELTDRFEGTGAHDIETFFQLAPGLEANAAGCALEARWRGGRLRVEPAGDTVPAILPARADGPEGWYSPAYGRKLPACTVTWRARLQLPGTTTFRVTVAGAA